MTGSDRLAPIITWRAAVARESGLIPTRRHVALTLALWMNEAGESAFPSQATLAAATGLSERCVRDSLAQLVTTGWLELVHQGGLRGKRRSSNQYRAAIPPLQGPRQQLPGSFSPTPETRSGTPATRSGDPGTHCLGSVQEESKKKFGDDAGSSWVRGRRPNIPMAISGDVLTCSHGCDPVDVVRHDGEPTGQGNARAYADHIVFHVEHDDPEETL